MTSWTVTCWLPRPATIEDPTDMGVARFDLDVDEPRIDSDLDAVHNEDRRGWLLGLASDRKARLDLRPRSDRRARESSWRRRRRPCWRRIGMCAATSTSSTMSTPSGTTSNANYRPGNGSSPPDESVHTPRLGWATVHG